MTIAMGAVAEELPHDDPADRIVVATAFDKPAHNVRRFSGGKDRAAGPYL